MLIATVRLQGSLLLADEETETWAFTPPNDSFADDALLDLRWMNEPQSGQSGFIRLAPDGNSFVRGDGQPIRFWAMGSDLYRRSPDAMDEHCRFLAKMGVNMVRLHATVANTEEGAEVTDVNEKEIDGVFRFIKAAKENGMYVTISPYYGHHNTPQSWKLEGYKPDQMPWGALFVDPQMQTGYRAWTRALYTRVNPYTGLAIKDDPTVAILQVHNEDSLFFWTMQSLPAPQVRRLSQSYAQWLKGKYGSLDKAQAAWDGHQEAGDDLAAGQVTLLSTWHLTQDWQGPLNRRLDDQVQFLAETQRAFYATMGRYLRDELGCRQLLNATNWRTANDLKLKDVERWTYAALDCDAENEYYGSDYQHVGENNGYRIDPGHFLVNESCLHKPLELTTNFKQHWGHPFLVTETSWKHPNLYQSEGPFLIAAYQSLGGVDAVYWFSADEPTWLLDPRRLFWKVGDSYALNKWSCSTPMLLGMFPAAATLFRRGYLREGDPVVEEFRSLDELWRRNPPLIDDNEIYGVRTRAEDLTSARIAGDRVSRVAYLVGPVQVQYGAAGKSRVTDLTPFLDAQRGRITSHTKQLSWNHQIGLCEMNTSRAQGVTGFLKSAGGTFAYDDVTIESDNDYATVTVVALDDRPLTESRKVLVQVGTTARLSGWRTEPTQLDFAKQKIEGERIVHTGSPPWRIANTQVTVAIGNPHLQRATRLNVSGYRAEDVSVTRTGDSLRVRLPADTMYLILH
jgi:hypothetical protein